MINNLQTVSIATDFISGEEAAQKLVAGVNKLVDIVKLTLGPGGKTVVIDKMYAKGHVTKDGVTVAKSIILQDPYENMGAELVKEAALKTLEEVGDGTTSTLVLAQAMINFVVDCAQEDMDFNKYLNGYLNKLDSKLEENKKQVSTYEEIKNIATLSANGEEEIGKLVADAFDKVKATGSISVVNSSLENSWLELREGMQFDSGYLSNAFVTNNENYTAEFKNPYIFLSENAYYTASELMPVIRAWEPLMRQSGRPLVIIASEIKDDCLAVLRRNKLEGGFPICAIRAPYEGSRTRDFLGDLAALTGANVFSLESGSRLSNSFKATDFGECQQMVVYKNRTIILHPANEFVNERCDYLNKAIEDSEATDLDFLKDRLAKLTTGTAIIHVGGKTEIEQKERRDRVEDAVCATRAALQMGVVEGAGSAYIVDNYHGFEDSIVNTICDNAGIEEISYDNVYDPVKVIKSAAHNAASVAKTILGSAALITIANNKSTN